jgi:hypothetical protein
MIRTACALIVAGAVEVAAVACVAKPNPRLTPGAVFPGVTAAQVCVPGYASSVRDVPDTEKAAVYAEYGTAHHTPGQYEIDHLIPLELGGSNEITNLWPQPAVPVPGYHQKYVLENLLHDLVCAGAVSLQVAQRAIVTDWLSAYHMFVAP